MNKQEYIKPEMRTILLESHEMICASEGSNLGGGTDPNDMHPWD